MAKQNMKETDINGEGTSRYVLEENDLHSGLTEQRFLRILVNPVDVVSTPCLHARFGSFGTVVGFESFSVLFLIFPSVANLISLFCL